jgi:plasmid replication initiation protein
LDIIYLRKILAVTNKYQSYKDFRIYIIDKAQKDLANYCDITFTYEAKRAVKGKKIESIIFHIWKNNAPEREGNTEEVVEKKEKITEVIEVFPSAESAQEKLIMELSPLVVTQFGVSLKVFMGLVELYTEGVIRQAVELTHKTIKAGKVENTAGFFVEAVRGNYTDPKAQKQEQAVAQKAKLVEIKKTEQASEQQKKDQKQVLYEQEVKIFTQLLENETSLIPILIDKVQGTMFRSYYKADTSFAENLKHPLLKAAFLNAAKEVRPFLFGL